MISGKKADGALLAIIALLVIIIIIVARDLFIPRECKEDDDCAANQYCGSDFECHDIPIVKENSFIVPALIIAIGLIIAAIILRWNRKWPSR
ncbi:hypothetical protein HYW21_06080 [Candidatus Woesearchaeota archaeon]|nr:hypothetical protein [Candidatus Woesearchaeota archaeon]